MRFLLDTNAVISLLGQKSEALIGRLLDCSEGEIGIPAIVSHELYFGAYKSQRVSGPFYCRALSSDVAGSGHA